jgi:fatty acid desaturase
MDELEYKALIKDCAKLKPSWFQGMQLISIPFLLIAIALYLNTFSGLIWFLGQILIFAAFTQLFVVVHEAGHNSLLPNTKANIIIGNIASIFAVVPFFSWKLIHRQHHLLTGWRDRDPTTKIQVSDEVKNLSQLQIFINNLCWKLWIPLFSFYYRAGTYWNAKSVLWAIKSPADRVKIFTNIALLIGLYGFLFYFYGGFIVSNFLLGFYMSLAAMDVIMLSQHSHIPMPVSEGQKVKNFSNKDQVQYTRSLLMPKFMAKYLFLNFNYHELHHLLPTLPCYYLDKIDIKFSNTENFFNWMKRAKRIDAVTLVFKTRKETNLNI